MVKLDIREGKLHIKMPLIDKVMSAHPNLEINLSDISNIRQLSTFEMPTGVKIIGTRIGKKAYGTFEHNNEREFWVVNNNPTILLIELGHNTTNKYKRLFLGVEDPGKWVTKLSHN